MFVCVEPCQSDVGPQYVSGTSCTFRRQSGSFRSTKQDLPTCPPLPIKPACFVVSMPEVKGQKRGKGETPLLYEKLEPNRWKCCERPAASTVTSVFLFVSCLRGVAADGRVSSRWPLWCHTLWQAVCFERLVFPLLHSFCFHSTVPASGPRRPLAMYNLWCGGPTQTLFVELTGTRCPVKPL